MARAVTLALARIRALTAADRWNFLVAFALALVRAVAAAVLVACFFGAVVFFLVAGRVVLILRKNEERILGVLHQASTSTEHQVSGYVLQQGR